MITVRVPDNILVTGGAGFIGSHAAVYFAERGAEVTILDNLSRVQTLRSADESRNTAGYNWSYIKNNYPDIRLVRGDIRDFDTVDRAVSGHDAVLHTAGQVAVTSSIDDPRTDFEVNALGTFNVIEGARNASPSPTVAFASTNKVYGDNINQIPTRESAQRYEFDDHRYSSGIPESFSIDDCEHTPYGTSKLAADLYIQDYAARRELNAAAFRMSCIYGTRQFGAEDQGWVAHFAISAIEDEPLTIYGDGKQIRDVLYVSDLIRAYHSFFADPEGKPPVYNIGGGPDHTTSLLELLDILEDITGNRPPISFEDWREGDQRVYVSDISRVSSVLEWSPTVDLRSGLKRFTDWYHSR